MTALKELNFFSEDIDFIFEDKTQFNKIWTYFAEQENVRFSTISYIFCSDNYLLEVNKQYLKHDYFTDIITFDYTEDRTISGDIFISIDTVRKNSEIYKTSFQNELRRVMIHGLLHLAFYDDKTETQKKEMRARENFYLEYLEQA